MARVRPQPLLLISILDPTTQEGLIRGAFVLNQLHKTVITVCTAIANQNDIEVDNITWLSFEEIKRQLDAVGRRYWIDWAVVSGISDLNLASGIVDYLHRSRPGIKILWEPAIDSHEKPLPLNQQEQTTFLSIGKRVFLTIMPHKLLYTQFSGNEEEKLISQLTTKSQILFPSSKPEKPHRLYYKKGDNNLSLSIVKNSPSQNSSTLIFLACLGSLLYEGLEIEAACPLAFDFWESYPIN